MSYLSSLHLGILRQGLSLDWSSLRRLSWLVSELQESSCLSLSSTGITSTFYHTYGLRGLNSGPYAYMASNLLTRLILNVKFRDCWALYLSSPQSPLLKGSMTFPYQFAGEQAFNTHDLGNISDSNFSRGNNKELTKHSSIPVSGDHPRAAWWWQNPLHSLVHYCLPNQIS